MNYISSGAESFSVRQEEEGGGRVSFGTPEIGEGFAFVDVRPEKPGDVVLSLVNEAGEEAGCYSATGGRKGLHFTAIPRSMPPVSLSSCF